jgi:hypothetical protein
MSLIQYLTAASLFTHIQKANQVHHSSGFIHAFLKTAGCIIQAQRISIHFDISFCPVLGFVYSYLVSISNQGSTNGKYQGLILISTSF